MSKNRKDIVLKYNFQGKWNKSGRYYIGNQVNSPMCFAYSSI